MTFEESVLNSLDKITMALGLLPTSVPQQEAVLEAMAAVQRSREILESNSA